MCDSDDDCEEKCVKLVVIGDGSAGKTSIINRFVNTVFDRDYKQTIGVDFYSHILNLPGLSVRLQVWDIGGQTLGGPLLDGYIYGANGILFVYDITNNSSFENMVDWLESVKKTFEAEKKKVPYMALVGNKVDMEHSRAVRIDKHEKFCHDSAMSSHFVSARTGDSVTLCMYSIVAEICGIRLTQAELNRQKAVVKAEIKNVSGSVNSGLKAPKNQSRLLNKSVSSNNDDISNGRNCDQSNSQACIFI